ncbi:MAG: DUF4936 family protein [Betaproteobacteria bacterium]|nr:DUF4936 family protein [Betaproteobacteria bacterium]
MQRRSRSWTTPPRPAAAFDFRTDVSRRCRSVSTRPPEMTSHYYVYYRVASGSESAAARAVADVQRRVQASTGVKGRVLRRADEPTLWMEVYETVTDAPGFERALADATASCGFEAVLSVGEHRHTEHFVD